MSDFIQRIRGNAFWQSFLGGLAPAELVIAFDVPPLLSPEEALRGGPGCAVLGLGEDCAAFRSVIEREYGRTY